MGATHGHVPEADQGEQDAGGYREQAPVVGAHAGVKDLGGGAVLGGYLMCVFCHDSTLAPVGLGGLVAGGWGSFKGWLFLLLQIVFLGAGFWASCWLWAWLWPCWG